MSRPQVSWYVYLIECTDGSLYAGIATDVARRFGEHTSGQGARYTRSHPPRELLGAVAVADRSAALKAEHALRQLTPAGKRAWIATNATETERA
jgi:putative endonuclease